MKVEIKQVGFVVEADGSWVYEFATEAEAEAMKMGIEWALERAPKAEAPAENGEDTESDDTDSGYASYV